LTTINPTGQLAALIRDQVSVLQRPACLPARGQVIAQRRKSGKSLQDQDLANLVALRVRALDPDDPQRERKAFRVFLESVLLAELGENLINDPAFYRMVDDIQQQMEDDGALASSIHEASRQLLAV
jgi:hypothetical protein